jgi:hypothetical protein
LSNNVLKNTNSSYNKIGDNCYNNHFEGFASNNKIQSGFYNNIILGDATDNNIGGRFYNNVTSDIINNSIFCQFSGNLSIGIHFRSNSMNVDVSSPVSNYDFTGSSHVANSYNCYIFLNSVGDIKLSYYNSSNALTVVDITD